tara:strand:- start:396 stop:1856 length:1461 start_codon:yes stop_codon:yes gene_type:complete
MKKIFTILALTIGFSVNAQFWSQGTVSTAIQTANAKASAEYSTAMGYYTTASDYGSLVIGRYNSSGFSVTSNATSFDTANTAFVIGNGTSSNKSDALTVLFDGTTKVAGSLTATAFIGDGSQLTGLPTGGGSPFSLNATSSDGIQSNNNTASGDTSTAMGDETTASGNASTAIGKGTKASGNISTAMGWGTIASADYSTAMGAFTTASGNISTAMGNGTIASADYSTAMGTNTTASGLAAIAMGGGTTASGNTSTAMGSGTTASGGVSTAMGNSTKASGDNSTAMGYETTASDFGSLVIGQYNSSGSSVTNSEDSFSTANTAFVIGNGADTDNKADAFKVLFNGDTTIGNDLTVSGDVVVSSDARLKANIVSLGATLAKLLLIDGKSYTMKKDGKQKIGVLAQDIQKVFPELVSTDDRDMLAVNYQGLVPVLINALKEQDAKMKEQDAKMNVQQSEIDRLKEQDAKMKEQEERLERLEAIISKIDK